MKEVIGIRLICNWICGTFLVVGGIKSYNSLFQYSGCFDIMDLSFFFLCKGIEFYLFVFFYLEVAWVCIFIDY